MIVHIIIFIILALEMFCSTINFKVSNSKMVDVDVTLKGMTLFSTIYIGIITFIQSFIVIYFTYCLYCDKITMNLSKSTNSNNNKSSTTTKPHLVGKLYHSAMIIYSISLYCYLFNYMLNTFHQQTFREFHTGISIGYTLSKLAEWNILLVFVVRLDVTFGASILRYSKVFITNLRLLLSSILIFLILIIVSLTLGSFGYIGWTLFYISTTIWCLTFVSLCCILVHLFLSRIDKIMITCYGII